MDTGRDLVNAMLRKLGVLASGEAASADEASEALDAVNLMLESWSAEKLTIYAIEEESFTLTANDGSYTMGSGGDFNTTRPQWIEKVVIRDSSVSPAVDYPVNLYSLDEYVRETVKGITSDYPCALYSDGGNPLLTLKLYPVPASAKTLVLWSAKPLTSISSLDTTLSFPPGYKRALLFNGALEIAPEYGREPSTLLVSRAIESKANIKVANHKPMYLRCDEAVTGGGRYNIYSGDVG